MLGTLLGGIGAALTGAAGIGNAIYNGIHSSNVAEQQQANVEAQRQYDREMTEKQWARDDTAMSRAVADYQNAGLNPILAVGGKGFASSAPVTQNYGAMANEALATEASAKAEGFQNLASNMQSALNLGMSMAKFKAEAESVVKDNEIKDLQIARMFAENPLLIRGLELKNKILDNNSQIGRYHLNIAQKDWDFTSRTHEKRVSMYNSQMNSGVNQWLDFTTNMAKTIGGMYLGYKALGAKGAAGSLLMSPNGMYNSLNSSKNDFNNYWRR